VTMSYAVPDARVERLKRPGWRRAWRGRFTVALGVLALTAGSLPASPVRGAEPTDVTAARHLAAELGRSPGDVRALAARTIPAPGGGSMWAGKLVDLASGQVHTVYVAADGTVGGPELLASRAGAEAALLAPLERKADAALLAATAAEPSTATLRVALWLAADPAPAEQAVQDRHPELEWIAGRPLAPTTDSARTVRAELWEARRGAYAAAAAPVAQRVTELGGEVAYASTSAPLLFVDLPAGAAANVATLDGVTSMALEQPSAATLSSAGPAVAANWTGGSGDQGNGTRVAIVEYHNVHGTGNMAGQVVRSHSTSGSLAYRSGAGDHPTWVAGAVASLHGTYRGVAPGADIVSSSTGGYRASLTTDRAIIAAADWAVNPAGGDADVLNLSIAQDTAQGAEEGRRYFDSVAWEDARTVVASAGNYGTFGHWDVLSPATGWNVLAVGGIDDRGTAATGDDRLWYGSGAGSSYRDPAGRSWNPHGDFNKPNVSAPAVNVRTANGMIGNGTSVASPIVAGVVAQLMARDSTLLTWPEAVRAVVLAGALRRTPLSSGAVSTDHEGVGTASALWSNRILARGGGAWGGYQVGSVRSGQRPSHSFTVEAGQRVRVALSWSSHTSGSTNTGKSDALTADLDLRVSGPSGVIGSYSWDNNYEVVEFVARRAGTVRAEVLHDRFDAAEEPYAVAWALAPPFTDIDTSPFFEDIMWAYRAGITAGCSATSFCPSRVVTREQMASFLVRALRLPAASRDFYTDDGGSPHQADINRLAAAGITTGCTATRFCPRSAVSRAEMASFLARAYHLGRASRDYFTDDERSVHESNINRVAAARITAGCSASRFCPTSPVTRGQMVAFLHRAATR
jgi:hypothetical protein